MSIAVANWEEKDARKEIHSLVDSVREKGFSISKDLVLKSFLYLYGKDIKFKVTNFSKENAKNIEEHWEEIRKSILSAFDLLNTLDANENMSKADKSLKEWIDKETKNTNRPFFLEKYLIPDVDLSLENFEKYIKGRKKILSHKLKELLL